MSCLLQIFRPVLPQLMCAKMMGFDVISFPIFVAAFPNSGLALDKVPYSY